MVELYDLRRDVRGRAYLVKVGEAGLDKGLDKVTQPKELYEICCTGLGMNYLAEEVLYMFAVNSADSLIGACLVSKGTIRSTLIGTREIFVRALLLGASSIFLAHNHPSGDPEPTPEDMGITKIVRQAGELLSVELLDHIIVGEYSYYSFHENA